MNYLVNGMTEARTTLKRVPDVSVGDVPLLIFPKLPLGRKITLWTARAGIERRSKKIAAETKLRLTPERISQSR